MWEEDALGSRLSSAAIWLSVLKPTVHINFFFVLPGIEPEALHVPGKHSTHRARSPTLFTFCI